MENIDRAGILREWYKPTKLGEEARRILSDDAGLGKKKAQH